MSARAIDNAVHACVACGNTTTTIARHVSSPVPSDVLRCEQCGLLWRETPSEDLYGKSMAGKQVYHERVAAARARLWQDVLPRLEPHRRSNRILDIGCGTGHFLIAAKQAGWEAEGIDPSPPDGLYAKEKLGLRVKTCAFTPGLYEPGAYDVVTLWNVLDHIPAPGEALAEIHRLLRAGGLLALRVPNGAMHLAMHRASLWLGKKDLSVFPNYSFNHRSLKALLSAAGFNRQKILNGVPSTGDPYGLFHSVGSFAADGMKGAAFALSQGLYYLTAGRVLAAPSFLAFARKDGA